MGSRKACSRYNRATFYYNDNEDNQLQQYEPMKTSFNG